MEIHGNQHDASASLCDASELGSDVSHRDHDAADMAPIYSVPDASELISDVSVVFSGNGLEPSSDALPHRTSASDVPEASELSSDVSVVFSGNGSELCSGA